MQMTDTDSPAGLWAACGASGATKQPRREPVALRLLLTVMGCVGAHGASSGNKSGACTAETLDALRSTVSLLTSENSKLHHRIELLETVLASRPIANDGSDGLTGVRQAAANRPLGVQSSESGSDATPAAQAHRGNRRSPQKFGTRAESASVSELMARTDFSEECFAARRCFSTHRPPASTVTQHIPLQRCRVIALQLSEQHRVQLPRAEPHA